MGRLRRVDRRFALLFVLVVLPGLVGVEPVAAQVGEPEPPSGVPTLSLPEQELRVPTEVPVAEAVVPEGADLGVVPEEARREFGSAEDLPEVERELVGDRSATGEVWLNEDGSETIKLHQQPIHFQADGSQAWERIDNELVPDPSRPGWVRNGANDWTVWFGPVSEGGGGGVEFATDGGTARFSPVPARRQPGDALSIAPVVGEGDAANTVTYSEVWPGVDLVYTVSGGAVKEDIVVSEGAQSEFEFVVEGLDLTADGSGLEVQGPLAGEIEFAPIDVVDAEGELANDEAAPEATVEDLVELPGDAPVPAGAQRLVLTVDEEWLASQADEDEPVVIDPTVVIPASGGLTSYKWSVFGGQEHSCACGVRIGNSMDSFFGGAAYWRTVGSWPYYSHVNGKQLEYAGVWLGSRQGNPATWNPELLQLWYSSGWNFHHAVHGDGNPLWKIDETVLSTDGWQVDVTDQVFWWMVEGNQNGLFGFAGDDDPSYNSFMQFNDAVMVLNVNNRPPAPPLVGPADNALTITGSPPTLSWNTVTDPDGQPVKYVAKIATGIDAESGLVATSPELTGTSWTVPEDVLQDGVTYYWKVMSTDTKAWVSSPIRRLTVDRRLGAGSMSPSDSFDGASTNLLTGNAALEVDIADMPSIGGGVGVDLVYNAQQKRQGLVGTYREDVDKDKVIEASDPVKLVRTDPRVAFHWTKTTAGAQGLVYTSEAPSPGVPHDWYSVRWTGFVTPPSGFNWQFGVASDDGVRLKINGSTVVDKWVDRAEGAPDWETGNHAGGNIHPISLDYYEEEHGASVKLYARKVGETTFSPVPASWLSPEIREMPVGWSVEAADMNVNYVRAKVSDGSVTLTGPDGETSSFSKTAGGGYTPPADIEDVVVVNGDGKVTVYDDLGYTYVFNPSGSLKSITSAVDDRKPAAATTSYDSLGRLETLTDPVSGRTITLKYAASNGDPACPNNPSLPFQSGFASVENLLCKITNWDGTATELFYKNGVLGYVVNPGTAVWGFSYDTAGRLIGYHDPLTYDAAISGARTDWAELLTGITYDTTGRVESIESPPSLQGDLVSPKHTYAYSPAIGADGMLTGGTATVTRAGVAGTHRSVGYDHRGRTTTESDALGRTTTTYWDANDRRVATRTSDGLVNSTLYNSRNQPTDAYGPAPESMFDMAFGATWGIYQPKPAHVGQVPREQTRYDEGIDGLAMTWWNNVGMDGNPVLHQHNPGALNDTWTSGSFPAGIVNADNIAARMTGEIQFGATGLYKLRVCAGANDLASLFVADAKRTEIWAVPNAACSPDDTFKSYTTFFPNETQRIQIDYADLSGASSLHLQWWRPGASGWETVPASALRPGYGLETSTTDASGKVTATEYTDTAAGIGPEHALPVRSIVDPGGLNLTTTIKYETTGTGYLRPIETTLPAGAATKTTNTHYGADDPATPANEAETRDNPCTTASDPANQGGMLKLDASADPDGTGPQSPIVREVVYDASGRAVAYRYGSGTLTSSDWICTTYDARGRITEVKYPAYGGQPTRTVTNSYLVDPDGSGPRVASPLVNTITDPAGTITAETDLRGAVIAYTDVFNNTTLFTYDVAGRELTNTGPVGAITKTYDTADRLTSLSRNGQVLAENLTYNTGDDLTSVTYPTGAGKAGNGTTGTFDYDPTYKRLEKITWTGPGGTITSDEVTRNLAGDITGQIIDGTDHHAGNDYLYDNAGRLTAAWVPGRHLTYQFTPTGGCGTLTTAGANTNRTRQIIDGGATTDYCYDNADRITSATDPVVGTIAYDTHGNTTSIFGETRTYDADDRHLSTTKGATTVTYKRDATDRIIERRLNSVVQARYGATGSGDAPDFTTDATNALLEVTYSLPGGAMLTTRSAGNVWSYPNTHGNVTAIADQAGAKQGPTVIYDPYGNLVTGTTPDNSTGNLDYGWLGQHQRPVEHEATLQPVIEMGARQYSPLLGRFLEVDPVAGGSANDYDYVNADPINSIDLDGERRRRRCTDSSTGMPTYCRKRLNRDRWIGGRRYGRYQKRVSNPLISKRGARRMLRAFQRTNRDVISFQGHALDGQLKIVRGYRRHVCPNRAAQWAAAVVGIKFSYTGFFHFFLCQPSFK